jgi:hypothetical protein
LATNTGNEEFTAFTLEGNIIEGGLDTGANTDKDKSDNNKIATKKHKMRHDLTELNVKRFEVEETSLLSEQKRYLAISISALIASYIILNTTLMKMEESDIDAPSDKKKRRIENYTELITTNKNQRIAFESELKSLNESIEPKKVNTSLRREEDLDSSISSTQIQVF